MTKFLLFAALFISINIYGQNLDGIMNVKFGSSVEIVKKEMLSRSGVTLDNKSDTSYLLFKNVYFGGRETLFVSFKFYKNKFHTATVIIMPAFEQKLADLYALIKSELDTKYFKGKDYPNADVAYIWEFSNPQSKDKLKNTIIMNVTEYLNIELTYQDGLLAKPVLEAKKAKDKSDY